MYECECVKNKNIKILVKISGFKRRNNWMMVGGLEIVLRCYDVIFVESCDWDIDWGFIS